MARKKAGKIIRMALRGADIATVLRNDYIQGTQQGANAFTKNFVKYLQFYVPQIKEKYMEIIMKVTGKQDPAEALHEYLTHKSLYYEQVWREVVNATSKLAADYKVKELQAMPNAIKSALANAASGVAASKVEEIVV